MTPVPGLTGFPPILGAARFIDQLRDAGLLPGFCLDMGDRLCLDVTTPQSLANLGSDGGAAVNGSSASTSLWDLQFNGTVGTLSKDDYLRNTSSATANNDYSQNIRASAAVPWAAGGHKNNAAFTVGGWFYLVSNTQGAIFATSEIFWTNASGWAFTTQGAAGLGLYGKAGGASAQGLVASSAQALSRNAWHYLGMAVDEATGTVRFQVDGNVVAVGPGAFTFSDTSAADGSLTIGSNTKAHYGLGLNARIAGTFGWAAALSAAQMIAAFNATKPRFA